MLISQNDFLVNAPKEGALFTLGTTDTLLLQFTNYGARWVSLFSPDRNGNMGNSIIGYQTLDEFIHGRQRYFGAIIGRYANRIKNGRFQIEENSHQVDCNRKSHHLHGGNKGFSDVFWQVEILDPSTAVLHYNSFDGECGYPGNVAITLTISLKDRKIVTEFQAESDRATPINLTNHTYFNLSTQQEHSIYEHQYTIPADTVCEVDKDLIPTGDYKPVKNSFLDLSQNAVLSSIRNNQSYDHHYILRKGNIVAFDPGSGRKLSVTTTKPGMQFYTTDNIKGNGSGYYGQPLNSLSAFCFETQFAPDAMNHPNMDNVIFDSNRTYNEKTVFDFNP